MNNEIPVIKAYLDSGFEVIKGGWPDLLVAKDGKLQFIEIKGNGDKLSPKQIRVAQLLKSAGISVQVVKPKLYYGSEGAKLRYMFTENISP